MPFDPSKSLSPLGTKFTVFDQLQRNVGDTVKRIGSTDVAQTLKNNNIIQSLGFDNINPSKLVRLKEEPARAYRFIVSFGPDYDTLSQTIVSITSPEYDYVAKTLVHGGRTIKVAHAPSAGDFVCEFSENEGGKSLAMIKNWKGLIQNVSTGLYNYPIYYKRDVIVDLQSSSFITYARITLKGVFPTTTQPTRLSYVTSEQVVITQVFSVDSVSMTIPSSVVEQIKMSQVGTTILREMITRRFPGSTDISVFPYFQKDLFGAVVGKLFELT